MRIAAGALLLTFAALCHPGEIAAQGAGPNIKNNPIVAQRLVEGTLAAHPELNALTFHVTPPGSSDNIIVASNMAKIGKKADADDMKVIAGTPEQGANKAGDRYGVAIPMTDAKGERIGAMNVGYVYKAGDDTSRFLASAEALRDDLAKQIPDVASLMLPATSP